jgi:hypothetical protein
MEEYPMPLIFCINLDERKDRWNVIQNFGKEVGIQIIRLPAEKADAGWKGCGLSHAKACKIAKLLGLPWVLILEDDVMSNKERWDQFMGYLPTLWRRRDEWDYFNGGPWWLRSPRLFDKDAKLASGTSLLTHFVLYNRHLIDTIAEWVPKPEGNPVDCYLSWNFRCIFGYPHIAYQRNTVSNIRDSFADQEGDLKKVEDEIRDQIWPRLFPTA